jgi:hypothetical protein
MSLPMLPPVKSMFMASGTFSRPSTTVSRSLSLPNTFHLPKLRGGLGEAGCIVEDDESFYAQPLDQHRCEAGERRILLHVTPR